MQCIKTIRSDLKQLYTKRMYIGHDLFPKVQIYLCCKLIALDQFGWTSLASFDAAVEFLP